MKVYELMSFLEKLPAGKEVKVSICLTPDELVDGQFIGDGCYMLDLDIDDVDPEVGSISTTI